MKKSELRQIVREEVIRESLKDDHGGWDQLTQYVADIGSVAQAFVDAAGKIDAKNFKSNKRKFGKSIYDMKQMIESVEREYGWLLKANKQFKDLTGM